MVAETDEIELPVKKLLVGPVSSFWCWKRSRVNLIIIKCFFDNLPNL